MTADFIHIGDTPASVDTAMIDRLVMDAQNGIRRGLIGIHGGDRDAILLRRLPPTYAEFRHLLDNHAKARREVRKTGQFQDLDAPMGGPLLANLVPEFPPTPQGWIAYLARFHRQVMTRLPPPKVEGSEGFPEYVRQRHTLIVAGAGSGKSTLLKTLVHHYVAHTRSSVMILDPHGDLVDQVARWPELARSDRLVLIDAKLFPGMAVGLNPLDGRGMDLEARNLAADGFSQLFREFTGDLSPNMNLLTHYCAEVLFGVEEATLRDFMRMLRVPDKPRRGEEPTPLDPETDALMHQARNHPRQVVSDFFREEFDSDYYKSTRNSLRARLQQLLKNMPVEAMLTGGPRTVDLDQALNGGKVVLVDLLSFGDNAVRPVGLLFLAMVTAMAYRRESVPENRRVPVHLFIDELTELGGPEVVRIVNALRKFRVHATLAQQTGGQGFEGAEMKEALFNSTAIKILASDRPAQFAKLAGMDFDNLPALGEREFWVKWGDKAETRIVKTDARFVDDRHSCSPSQWAETLAHQEAEHYRKAFQMPPAPVVPPVAPAPNVSSKSGPVPDQEAAPASRWRKVRAEPPELD